MPVSVTKLTRLAAGSTAPDLEEYRAPHDETSDALSTGAGGTIMSLAEQILLLAKGSRLK